MVHLLRLSHFTMKNSYFWRDSLPFRWKIIFNQTNKSRTIFFLLFCMFYFPYLALIFIIFNSFYIHSILFLLLSLCIPQIIHFIYSNNLTWQKKHWSKVMVDNLIIYFNFFLWMFIIINLFFYHIYLIYAKFNLLVILLLCVCNKTRIGRKREIMLA